MPCYSSCKACKCWADGILHRNGVVYQSVEGVNCKTAGCIYGMAVPGIEGIAYVGITQGIMQSRITRWRHTAHRSRDALTKAGRYILDGGHADSLTFIVLQKLTPNMTKSECLHAEGYWIATLDTINHGLNTQRSHGYAMGRLADPEATRRRTIKAAQDHAAEQQRRAILNAIGIQHAALRNERLPGLQEGAEP